VELALKFNGEIINADAIQMYRGLPIVTNKIPQDERNGIAHHLLDRIGLEEQPWTVHEFVEESSKIIEQIRGRGKLPVVVGGTNYYVFSLLFADSTVANEHGDAQVEGKGSHGSLADLAILDAPTEQIYAKLQEVDPDMARSWHPNDRRRIQRSLEIWLKSGKKASEIYAEQKAASETSVSDQASTTLRFDPVIFWLDAEDAVLKQRLNARVDTMVGQGLLDEVRAMRQFEMKSKSEGVVIDKTKGVWVAIGYKELEPWLNALESQGWESATHQQLSGIESVKASTRQYAKRQNRWVRIRLAEYLVGAHSLNKLFLLDCTNVAAWGEMVASPATDLVGRFLFGEELPANTSMSKLASQTFAAIFSQGGKPNRQTHYCESCNKTLMNEQEWKKHLRSQSHKKVVEGARKRAQRDLYKAKMAENG